MSTPASDSKPWRGVFFDGPQSDQNEDGDEIPLWVVYVGDEDANPVDSVHRSHDFEAANQFAHELARKHRLELIHEASPD